MRAVGFPFSNTLFKTWEGARIFYILWYQMPNFEDKNYTVSVPYLTVFGFLADNSLRIDISITLKTSSHIVGKRSCRYS